MQPAEFTVVTESSPVLQLDALSELDPCELDPSAIESELVPSSARVPQPASAMPSNAIAQRDCGAGASCSAVRQKGQLFASARTCRRQPRQGIIATSDLLATPW